MPVEKLAGDIPFLLQINSNQTVINVYSCSYCDFQSACADGLIEITSHLEKYHYSCQSDVDLVRKNWSKVSE